MSGRTYTVFEVLYHVADDHRMAYGGPMGDGSFIMRFRNETEAKRFAAKETYYGKPCTVSRVEKVPARLAQRWGVA